MRYNRLRYINICFLAIFALSLQAQNLVFNGSFEIRDSIYQSSYFNYYSCPYSDDSGPSSLNKQLPMAKGWSNPEGIYNNQWLSSSDYFHACSWDVTQIPPGNGPGSVGTPNNYWMGYQVPRTGEGYAGSIVYSVDHPYHPIDPGEFVQSKLKSKLQSGVEYKIVYFVSLANFCMYAIKAHGIYLSPNKPDITELCTGLEIGTIQPQIMNQNGFLTDSVNWTKIEGSFIANGDEEYLSIGNFDVRKGVSKYLYLNICGGAAYLVEDIAIFPVDAPIEFANCGNDTLICLGESIELGKTKVLEEFRDEYTFEWYLIGEEDSIISTDEHPVFTPNTTTTYIVNVTDFKFDKSSDTITVTVVDCQEPTSLKVYPNPSEGIFNFEFNSPIPDEMTMDLFDITGRCIKSVYLIQNYNIKKFMINLCNHAAGIYLFRINISGEPKFCGKIIKA